MPVAAVRVEEQLAWLALRMVPGLGARRAVPLVRKFGTVDAVFAANPRDLIAAGLDGAVAQSIASGCAYEDAADQAERVKRAGAVVVPFQDPAYPELLRQIYDPPLLLFARGRLDLLSRAGIGVVGTRRPTPYGTAATDRLAGELARTGLVITSGLARGIDTAAHKAALTNQGDTIAVFGSGVDHIYPAENRRLAEDIVARGLLLSEFPMGNPGHPQNFPVRNRIISGLSLGILLVEGAQYSGSAITAQLAMDQGRDVFAVPGNITSKMSWTPNLLIKQGAKLVQSAEDVLAELRPEVRAQLASLPVQGSAGAASNELARVLGPNARLGESVLGLLRVDSGVHLDALVESLEAFPASEIIAVLFELQLLGLVKELPGKNFVKVWVDPAGL
ncbi:MAG: DNA-protecting protein DprA [Bryobacterales bacterium]|nr:DNA-protecting protein DprA [Bryobacterales bacterium]